MVIGPNYVYIALPRTASQSISQWLVKHHRGVLRNDLYHFSTVPEEHKHKPVFTVVRNPYDRMASLYRMMVEKFFSTEPPPDAKWAEIRGASLAEFVRWCAEQNDPTKPQWWSQARILEPLRRLILTPWEYEKVPQFENFEALPHALWGVLGGQFYNGDKDETVLGDLPHTNVTKHDKELLPFTSEEIEAIDQHSALDFEVFNYVRKKAE